MWVRWVTVDGSEVELASNEKQHYAHGGKAGVAAGGLTGLGPGDNTVEMPADRNWTIEIVKRAADAIGFELLPRPLDRRANLRLAQSQSPCGKGFRGIDRQRQGMGLHRLHPAPSPGD